MTFATKLVDVTHLTLDMLLRYLGKLKIQIFGRYSDVAHYNFNADQPILIAFCR